MYPTLHATIRAILVSPAPTIAQFILEPLAFQLILSDFITLGHQFAQQLAYLTRTFAFYIHREHQKLLKSYNNPTPKNNDCPQSSNISYVPAVPATTRCDDAIPAVCDLVSYPLHVNSVSAVTARPDGSTRHLSPTRDSPTPLQPAPCHRGAPHSTSNTCSHPCNIPALGITHAQSSSSGGMVQVNMVTVPTVATALCHPPAAHHAPVVHDLHPDCGPVDGVGVREEAEKILTVANITY